MFVALLEVCALAQAQTATDEGSIAETIDGGTAALELLDDNNMVTPLGRVELELLEHVTLAANAYYNVRGEGMRPNRLTSNQLGYGADLSALLKGFNVLIGAAGKSITYAELPADQALGVLGQLTYQHERTGLGGGVRFAILDPSTADPLDNVSELAVMISWSMRAAPLRVLLQYTHREEAPGISIANDSADAMLEAAW